jgi:ABC-type hemin transport system substrate-binding protein
MAKKAKQYGTEKITFDDIVTLAAELSLASASLSRSMQIMSLLELPSIEASNVPTLRRTAKEIQPAIEAIAKAVNVEDEKRKLIGKSKLIAAAALEAEAKANNRTPKK